MQKTSTSGCYREWIGIYEAVDNEPNGLLWSCCYIEYRACNLPHTTIEDSDFSFNSYIMVSNMHGIFLYMINNCLPSWHLLIKVHYF